MKIGQELDKIYWKGLLVFVGPKDEEGGGGNTENPDTPDPDIPDVPTTYKLQINVKNNDSDSATIGYRIHGIKEWTYFDTAQAKALTTYELANIQKDTNYDIYVNGTTKSNIIITEDKTLWYEIGGNEFNTEYEAKPDNWESIAEVAICNLSDYNVYPYGGNSTSIQKRYGINNWMDTNYYNNGATSSNTLMLSGDGNKTLTVIMPNLIFGTYQKKNNKKDYPQFVYISQYLRGGDSVWYDESLVNNSVEIYLYYSDGFVDKLDDTDWVFEYPNLSYDGGTQMITSTTVKIRPAAFNNKKGLTSIGCKMVFTTNKLSEYIDNASKNTGSYQWWKNYTDT